MNGLQSRLDQLGKLDCAIIGGGVSGLYTGWRLREARPEWNVAVFEMSDRTGGRLLTWLPYGPESGLRAELGGMRFFEQQQLVWNLIKQLDLAITPFFVAGPNLLWYLRGQRMAAGDANTAALRYALDQGERGIGPGDLLAHAIDLVLGSEHNRGVIQEYLQGRPPASRQDWDAIKPYLTYKDQPLWNLGFWNVLSDLLSYEAYRYVTDAFGYYTLTGNWNAAEAMQSVFLDFTQNPNYQTLVEGYSQLPETLDARFRGAGGQVLLDAQLRRFEAEGDGSFALSFRDNANDHGELRVPRLVLALPRASLDFIEPSPTFNPQENPKLERLFDAVAGYPAFKLFLLYETRWWEQTQGITHGRSVSDLPIRQTYYFRPDACESATAAGCPDYGLVMASYDDGQAVDYWKGMEAPPAERQQHRAELRQLLQTLHASFSGRFAPASDGGSEPPPNFHLATEEMVRRATEQLALLHGVNAGDIPAPRVGAYADWSLAPFGGGWNFWQPQANVKEVMTQVKQPLGEGHQVYLVGEAYSGAQGWVEGALTATELVLRDKFGLPRPPWLPADYYLGW